MILPAIKTMANKINKSIITIQMGERTQIQDQSIYPVSFKASNNKVRPLVNPIPLFLIFILLILCQITSFKDFPNVQLKKYVIMNLKVHI